MLLIKNDPEYNEQWPRALVPYKRIYGIDEPQTSAAAGQRRQAVAAPAEGTPFGLVGTSSLYKRESYPNGVVPPGSVTATFAGGNDATDGYPRPRPVQHVARTALSLQLVQPGGRRRHVRQQRHSRHPHPGHGADHRPPARPEGGRDSFAAMPTNGCASSAKSRCASSPSRQAEPAPRPGRQSRHQLPGQDPRRRAFTFQTLDKNGMVLNMAQTWHQLRPGEIRNDCGGCHAHSQKPTLVQGHRRRQAGLRSLRPDASERRC